MSLQLKEEIVSEAVGSIPAVQDGNFFVFSIGLQLPLKAIMF